MKRNQITEYTLIFKSDEEYITEDINEADEMFEQRKDEVDQYYSKRWILDNEDWKEDYVEVFYSAKEDGET